MAWFVFFFFFLFSFALLVAYIISHVDKFPRHQAASDYIPRNEGGEEQKNEDEENKKEIFMLKGKSLLDCLLYCMCLYVHTVIETELSTITYQTSVLYLSPPPTILPMP